MRKTEFVKPNKVVAPPFTEDMVRALMKHLQETTLPGVLTGIESRLLNDFYDIVTRELTILKTRDNVPTDNKRRRKRF